MIDVQYQLQDLPQIAQHLLSAYPQVRIFAFIAPMGTGKTTLIKAICKELGVVQNTASPTFAIVSEYGSETDASSIFHIDGYRLETVEDAYNVGMEEYFNSGCYCFVEWPDCMFSMLPEDSVLVQIQQLEDGKRWLRTSRLGESR